MIDTRATDSNRNPDAFLIEERLTANELYRLVKALEVKVMIPNSIPLEDLLTPADLYRIFRVFEAKVASLGY